MSSTRSSAKAAPCTVSAVKCFAFNHCLCFQKKQKFQKSERFQRTFSQPYGVHLTPPHAEDSSN
jgi:hypothetical protein